MNEGCRLTDPEYLFPIWTAGPGRTDPYRCGFIDRQGAVVVEPTFSDCDWFCEGLGAVRRDGRWGFVDSTGQTRVECSLRQQPKRFCEGLCAFPDQRGRWGYLNTAGQVVIAPKFDLAGDFSEGKAHVRQGSHVFFISKSGEALYGRTFDDGRGFSGGMAPVSLKGIWGYWGEEGEWAIAPKFKGSIARPMSEGLCAVEVGGRFGFVDPRGEFVIPAICERTHDFREGRAAVGGKGEYFGFVDYAGALVVPMRCMYVGDFSEGVAWVTPYDDPSREVLIDRHGHVLVGPAARGASPYYQGLSLVECDRTLEYWDKDGTAVWTTKYLRLPFHATWPPVPGMSGGRVRPTRMSGEEEAADAEGRPCKGATP